MILFTIGHSNHNQEKLVQLLIDNGIQILVDVRTSPYSRYNPQFNKDTLEFWLSRSHITYIFSGKHLGGRPSDPSCYKHGVVPDEEVDFLHEVDYRAVMEKPWFQKAVEALIETAAETPTAILCSEEDPANCHRHHLIARYLLELYPEVEVRHIRGDGRVYGAVSILKSVDEEKGSQLKLF
jgi:uncharacterized protein (DUF488 family)